MGSQAVSRCPYLIEQLKKKGKTQVRTEDPDAINICLTCPMGEFNCWEDMPAGRYRARNFKRQMEKLIKDLKGAKEKLNESNQD